MDCADPALTTAAGLTVAATFAVLVQPALVSEYVYVPAVLVPGTNVPKLPPVKELVPDHVPPVAGKFSNELKRFTLVEFEQTLIAALVPALGRGFTVTVIEMGVPGQPFAVGVTV
jgi:hypothetical protein